MIDTWIISTDATALTAFCAGYPNVLGPANGRAAIADYTDPDTGTVYPGCPAAGDPDVWYACIRAESAVSLPEGCAFSTEANCAPIIGVWA